MKDSTKAYLELLGERYPELKNHGVTDDVLAAYKILEKAYKQGKKVLICGNGGSCSDSEHIVGELMKKFMKKRPLPDTFKEDLKKYGEKGEKLAESLEGALRAISLASHPALSYALINDIDGELTFAQQLVGLGDKGDVLIAISTSGNSKNCGYAAITAKAMGIKVIALTGAKGGKLAEIADVTVKVPETETYKVQEYHLPVYHCLCQMLEEEFFD
ncbi:MAG: SIS domain-containing protein [Clostridia bacterium]|nr:SIS domain-containing protein [Clostridia bacterium]